MNSIESCEIVEISEKVFWCVTPDDWNKAVAQLTEVERVAPNWRDKINIVWLLPGVQPADFVIQPDVRDFDITEFCRADEMSAIGVETTRELLPKLKQLLSRVDDKLFN